MRGALLAVCLVLSACGGGGDPAPSAPVVSAPAVAQPAQPAPQPAAPQTAPQPVVAAPASVALWGDSLTAVFSGLFQSMLPQRTVYQGGVGGQTSTQIAARQGGVIPVMRVAGDLIPASGPANVVAQSVLMQTRQAQGPITGSLAGVHGTMTFAANGSYAFTRDAAGDAISVSAAGIPFTVDTFGRREWPSVFWYGRNNAADLSQVLADVAASVAFLQPGTDYVVLSVLNADWEPAGSAGYIAVQKLNAALAAAYPDHFFDMRAYLVSQYDQTSPKDVADHANDVPPTSLLVDGLHMNPKGQSVVASKLKDLIEHRGW